MQSKKITLVACGVLGLAAFSEGARISGRNLQTDPHCYQWDFSTNECAQCSYRYYKEEGVCTEVSPDCKQWDASNGECTSCYDGYTLINGECVIPTRDPNCHNWNQAGHYCVECSFRHYQSSVTNMCEKVSDDCKSWDDMNGACTECYDGYDLNDDGECVLPTAPGGDQDDVDDGDDGDDGDDVDDGDDGDDGENGENGDDGNQNELDPNCHMYNDEGKCTQCSWRYYFDEDEVCQKVSDDCKDWNTANGQCTTCYPGYQLEDGECVL